MKLRDSRHSFKQLAVVAALSLLIAGVVAWPFASGGDDDDTGSQAPAIASVRAHDLEQATIYRSPQSPGYTSFVGAWIMPDSSLITAFVQATGELDPTKRERAPESVQRVLGPAHRGIEFDFWGLRTEVKFLQSMDGGASWQPYRTDRFRAVHPAPYAPQANVGLKDGTILRRVNGDDLRFDPNVPHTAFLQRLEDGRWSAPQVLLDPKRATYQLTRIRYLRDGRLLATGNVWDVPATVNQAERDKRTTSRFLAMVSDDDGRTWQNALTIPEDTGYLPGVEWDTAELPNGDLLAVIRTHDRPGTPELVRKQAILKKDGDGWTMTDVRPAPIPESGHPELLATREGAILHIATSEIDYTVDGGRSWRRLPFSRGEKYRSGYYPRAVQADDGTISVFSHVGGDDGYGTRDQSITLDEFRLTAEPARDH
jgi:hypothetical protein